MLGRTLHLALYPGQTVLRRARRIRRSEASGHSHLAEAHADQQLVAGVACTGPWANSQAEECHRQALELARVANLGLGTQTIQWLILQGSFFTVSVYLQEVNHYSAIQTGLIFTPATIGILAASADAARLARRHPQRWRIIVGFLVTAVDIILLLVLVWAHAGIWRWIPGLLLFGTGSGSC